MSMPQITLEEIDPRTALASIVASIALQEAAVSHVLNAEGEKIQAIAGLTGATVEDLRSVNDSVGTLVNNVSSLENDLQNKLHTVIEALYPGVVPEITGTLIVSIIDQIGDPVDTEGAAFVLINGVTFAALHSFSEGYTIRFNNIPPGDYILQQTAAPEGHTMDTGTHRVVVFGTGSVRFNGVYTTLIPPIVKNDTIGYSP